MNESSIQLIVSLLVLVLCSWTLIDCLSWLSGSMHVWCFLCGSPQVLGSHSPWWGRWSSLDWALGCAALCSEGYRRRWGRGRASPWRCPTWRSTTRRSETSSIPKGEWFGNSVFQQVLIVYYWSSPQWRLLLRLHSQTITYSSIQVFYFCLFYFNLVIWFN